MFGDGLNNLRKETLTTGFSRWDKMASTCRPDFSRGTHRINSPRGQAMVNVFLQPS
ncbi:hypothetical protein KJ656_04060 [bacterium]|nr:hypothetical protein [bacterium]